MKVIDIRDASPEQWRPGVETRMLVSARNGAAQLCIFEQWIAPGRRRADPFASGRGGADRARGRGRDVDGRGARHRLTAGQSLIVPAGRKHGFRNSGTSTLHLHAVLASPVFEAMLEGATETVRRWDTP